MDNSSTSIVTQSSIPSNAAVHSPSNTSETTWAILAALRLFLASIVFFGHLRTFVGSNHWFIKLSTFGPFSAVIGFFIVSGYSIAHSINQKPQGFIQRRAVRIYPIYFVSFLISLFPWLLTDSIVYLDGTVVFRQSAFNMVLNGVMLQAILVEVIASNKPAWSLSVEALYYCCAPGLRKAPKSTLTLAFVISLILFIAAAKLGWTKFAESIGCTAIVCLLWSWLVGWLYYQYSSIVSSRRWLIVMFFVVPGLVLLYNNQDGGRLRWMTSFLVMGVLLFAPKLKLAPLLRRSFLYAGDLSYPLYISHFAVFSALWVLTHSTNPWLYIASAFGVAVALVQFVDYPLRKGIWRHRS